MSSLGKPIKAKMKNHRRTLLRILSKSSALQTFVVTREDYFTSD